MQDVPERQVWGGYPAKPRMQWLREVAWLSKASRGTRKDTTGKPDGESS
jgi:UDP-3-O-[3-hydroxymyristoyl] glucosamine N-acyltransferase